MAGDRTVGALTTRRQALGQVVLCRGCCCGRTERGFPEVPLGRLQSIWKAEKLNRTIQLTVSGCLGPCDLANVAVLWTERGAEWFGNLAGDAAYDALVAWARACHAAGQALPAPPELAGYHFKRFVPSTGACAG
jgi:cobaltochelatase CobN